MSARDDRRASGGEGTAYWRVPGLDGLELLTADFVAPARYLAVAN